MNPHVVFLLAGLVVLAVGWGVLLFTRLGLPKGGPEPEKPAPSARPGTFSVQKCPCGSGYWIVRSNAPNGHHNGPLPTGENLARILREGR